MTGALFHAPPIQPTLTAADRAAAAAMSEAGRRGLAIAVAVVDASGQPLCLRRMETSRPITAAMAHAKAWTAMMNRRDTASLQDLVVPGAPAFGFQHQFPGVASILPGGIPLLSPAGVHAAVGVSGADKEGDVGCAETAVAELSQLLKGQDRGQD